MKEWLTAQEIADAVVRLRFSGLPTTKRRVQDHADREGWAECASLCRKRQGRGGGIEYHFSLLPERLVAAMQGEVAIAVAKADRAIRIEVEEKRLQALSTASLRSRQRAVMEKRAEILSAITAWQIANGSSQREAILAFIAAQEEYTAWEAATEGREIGAQLSTGELGLLQREPRLTAFDGFDIAPAALEIANDRSGGRRKIARSTIYEWFKARETVGVGALAPVATKEQQGLPAGFADFLRFYALPTKPCATEALERYREHLTAPARDLTIEQVRYTLAKKLNNIEKHVGREGLSTLKARLAYVQRSTENMWPTTIYTADGKTFDAEVTHPISGKPFKPEITSVVDVATRRCVGFAISLKENVIAVTEALRVACVAHGIPAIFYVDRGPGYKNKTFDSDVTGMMGRLSITKMHSLPYNSQARGIIERFNGSVWNPLARTLPTYLGEEMDREAAKAVHQQTRRDIRVFGHSKLLTPWEDFRQKCIDAIATYNAKPHTSLPKIEDLQTGKRRHMSPDEFWADHVRNGFEPVPVEPELVDDLFRPYETRVVRRAQIEWNNNFYFHLDLEPHHGDRVMVGYDFAEAHHVWVREIDRDHDGAEVPGALICIAEFGGNKVDYVPKSFQQAAEEKRTRGRVRLLRNKLHDAETELRPVGLIDLQPLDALPMIDVTPEPASVAETNVTALPVEPRRRVFASDEELAAWAIEHPSELSVNQLRVLRDCLQRPSALELFRLSGIDVEALRTVVRAAA